MPLIIISGYPASGKSTRTRQIEQYFLDRIAAAAPGSRESRLRVHVVSTESLGIDRGVYREARAEKEARATEYSAVKRLLGKDEVVIADGLNYIKGFRYQLFCEAKAVLTPSCVVHVAAPANSCRAWNLNRSAETPVAPKEDGNKDPENATAAGHYPEDVLENLIFRYEEPNGMTRWDSPLFVTPFVDEKPDLEGIWNAMVGKNVVVKANQATVLKPAAESNYLYELDKVTQEVVSLIMENQRASGGGGGSLPVPESSVSLELPPQDLSLPQLQRIRRQFIALNRKHTLSKQRIRELFVEYVNQSFE